MDIVKQIHKCLSTQVHCQKKKGKSYELKDKKIDMWMDRHIDRQIKRRKYIDQRTEK